MALVSIDAGNGVGTQAAAHSPPINAKEMGGNRGPGKKGSRNILRNPNLNGTLTLFSLFSLAPMTSPFRA